MTTTWPPQVIDRIAATDDLHIAPLRPDGVTTGTPTWIWSVVVSGRLFVRAWNGTGSRWYQAAIAQHAGQITAAGTTFDVEFTAVTDPAWTAPIDAAYRVKYASSPYLPPMLGPGPRAATVEITPAPQSVTTQ